MPPTPPTGGGPMAGRGGTLTRQTSSPYRSPAPPIAPPQVPPGQGQYGPGKGQYAPGQRMREGRGQYSALGHIQKPTSQPPPPPTGKHDCTEISHT